MTKTAFALAGILVLQHAAACATITDQQADLWLSSKQGQPLVNVSGKWKSPVWGPADFYQRGNRVTGTVGGGRYTLYRVRGVVVGQTLYLAIKWGKGHWTAKMDCTGNPAAGGNNLLGVYTSRQVVEHSRYRYKILFQRIGPAVGAVPTGQPAPPPLSPGSAAPQPVAGRPAAPASPPTHALSAELPKRGDRRRPGLAKARDRLGKKLHRSGDYKEALLEFKKAYRYDANPAYLYNAAMCFRKLGHYGPAYDYLVAALNHQGRQLRPHERKRARSKKRLIVKNSITITLTTNVPGATVLVDRVLMGRTPFARPIRLRFGYHRVIVSKSGYVTALKTIEATVGGTKTVMIRLFR